MKCHNCNNKIRLAPAVTRRVLIDGKKVALCPKCSVDYDIELRLQQLDSWKSNE